jgi:hypothetical protein
MSDVPSIRTAWRFFGLWGAIATALFLISTILTIVAVHVSRDKYDPTRTARQVVSIFTKDWPNKDADYLVRYTYDENARRSSVTLPALHDETVVLNNLPKDYADACVLADTNQRLELTPLGEGFFAFDLVKVRNLMSPLAAKLFQIEVTCALDFPIEKESFARRRTYFENKYGGAKYLGRPNTWTLDASHMEGADNIEFLVSGERSTAGLNWLDSAQPAGRTELASARMVAPGEILMLRWQSTGRESEREALFVLIGAFIAIGAAMFLEALRPFVERFVGRHEAGG